MIIWEVVEQHQIPMSDVWVEAHYPDASDGTPNYLLVPLRHIHAAMSLAGWPTEKLVEVMGWTDRDGFAPWDRGYSPGLEKEEG